MQTHCYHKDFCSRPLTLFPVFSFSLCTGGTCINYYYITLRMLDVLVQTMVSLNLDLHILNIHCIWQWKEWMTLKNYIFYSYCIQISEGLKDSMYMCREKSMSFLKCLTTSTSMSHFLGIFLLNGKEL